MVARIRIDPDDAPEAPDAWGASWKLVSFLTRKHRDAEEHEKYLRVEYSDDPPFRLGEVVPIGSRRRATLVPKPIVARKLASGLAFWLDYFEHGLCRWTLTGSISDPWDNSPYAGVLIWTGKPEELTPRSERQKLRQAVWVENGDLLDLAEKGDLAAKAKLDEKVQEAIFAKREDLAKSALEAWTQFYNGEVYCCSIRDPAYRGEHEGHKIKGWEDSCCGLYGDEAIEAYLADELKTLYDERADKERPLPVIALGECSDMLSQLDLGDIELEIVDREEALERYVK